MRQILILLLLSVSSGSGILDLIIIYWLLLHQTIPIRVSCLFVLLSHHFWGRVDTAVVYSLCLEGRKAQLVGASSFEEYSSVGFIAIRICTRLSFSFSSCPVCLTFMISLLDSKCSKFKKIVFQHREKKSDFCNKF